YLLTSAALVLAWELAALGLRTEALPEPGDVVWAFLGLLGSDLPEHFGVSLGRVAAAILLAVAGGLPLGLLMGRRPKVDAYLAPAVFLTYPVPKIVLLPIILLLLGLGDASKVTIIALILFFQILVTVRDAVRGIDEEFFLAVRSLNAGGLDVLRHVVLPATVGEILTALRISVGTAVAVLFFVETIGARRGLGYFIQDAWSRVDYLEMYAGILAMSLLGVLLYEVLEQAEKRVCRWRRA
ncbi:MAG: ABC transporter permease, partial [Nitrospinota bacterium]